MKELLLPSHEPWRDELAHPPVKYGLPLLGDNAEKPHWIANATSLTIHRGKKEIPS